MTSRADEQRARRDAVASGVGAEVRAAREARGLSTRRLAELIGTSQPFVSNIENAHIFPSLRTLALLAEALDVPANRLLPGSERTERIGAAAGMRERRATEPSGRKLLGAPDRDLAAWRVELRPGEFEPRPFTHDGEDYLVVIDGEVTLLREGMPPTSLARGDSVWVDGILPHRLAVPAEATSPGVVLIIAAASGDDRSALQAESADQPIETRVGSGIHAVRLRRRLSTRALARLAGISQPLLSKVENGLVLPSVPSLYAIAEALGVGPAELLPAGDSEPMTGGHGMPLSPSAENAPALVTMRLLHAASGRRIEAYRIDQIPGHSDEEPFQHSGEDIVHVLEGRVTLRSGETRLRLAAGDTAWIDGTTPHTFTTPRSAGVTAIIVTAR